MGNIRKTGRSKMQTSNSTLIYCTTSAGAQELYSEFGFDGAGVRQKYYDNVEDAIVMWCHEIQSDDYRALLDQIREAAHV